MDWVISARTALLLAASPLLLLRAPAQDAPDEAVIEDRISLLLAEMSVAEKAGQMTQLNLGAVALAEADAVDGHQLDPEKLRAAVVDGVEQPAMSDDGEPEREFQRKQLRSCLERLGSSGTGDQASEP